MSGDQVKLHIKVHPNAKRDEIVGIEDGILKIKISAQPVKGKANKALIELLSNLWGIRKSDITIEKGGTGKRKTILIEGATKSQVQNRLDNL